VIEWLPVERLEVTKVACPLTSVPEPIALPPSRKVTVPVAVAGETVALKVVD